MKVIFCGGGTAGHVNPAIAAADYFKKQEDCEIYFSGAKGGIEEKLVERAGYRLFAFPLAGLSRSLSFSGLRQNVRAGQNAFSAVREAKKILGEVRPDVVIGTGGYASYPMVAAAQQLGIKTALLEVNATPGVALKRLSRRADCVMLGFEETARLVKAKKTVLTGSPVREEIVRCRSREYSPVFAQKRPMILSFWGSVGALYMNKKMVDFVARTAREGEFNLLHAAGANNYKWMPDEIRQKGCDLDGAKNVDLREYIFEMDKAMANADLVICRAGASTLAEVCCAGLPAIIVPSPYVTGNHQEKNARLLERAGAAVVMTEPECTGDKLYETAQALLRDPDKLKKMGECALKRARPDALQRIYNAVKSIL